MVLAAYAAAVVLLTWPLARFADEAAVGQKLLDTRFIGRYLLDAPLQAWLAPDLGRLNYPDGGTAILVALPQFLVARWLAPLLGEDLAINASLALHLVFGAWAGFRLSRRVRGVVDQGLAAIGPDVAAGALFGLGAFPLSVFANGQPEGCGLVYLALSAEAAWCLVMERRWAALPALAVALAAAFLSSPYLVMALLVGAWPAGLAALVWRRRATTWVGALTVLAVCAGFTSYFMGTVSGVEGRLLCPAEVPPPQAELAFSLGSDPWRALASHPPVDPGGLALDPARMLAPGRAPRSGLHYYGGYVGLLALGLGLVGWHRQRLRGLALAGVVSVVALGLGPHLVVNGWVPEVAGGELRLPLWFLSRAPGLGPLFDTIQAPLRLIPGATLWLALGAALALGRLARPALGWTVALVLVAEQALVGPVQPPLPMFQFDPPDAYVALAAEPDRGALVDVPPLGYDRDLPAVVDRDPRRPIPPPVNFLRRLVGAAWTHGRAVPYGGCPDVRLFNASAMDSDFGRAVTAVLVGREPPVKLREGARQLHGRGYHWLVVHRKTGLLDPDLEARLVAALRAELSLVGEYPDGTLLFRLGPPP